MTDCLVLLKSTPQGAPQVGGPNWHLVRFADHAMTAVNQMTAGGVWPGFDCGDADIRSRCLDDGRDVSVRTIESYSGTHGPSPGVIGGTSIGGLMAALTRLGYSSRYVRGVPPGVLQGMNPAWGGLIPASQMGPYYAAAAGVRQYIAINTPVVVVNPQPIPGGVPTPEEDKVTKLVFAVLPNNAGVGAFISDGVTFRHVLYGPSEAAMAKVYATTTYNDTASASAMSPEFADAVLGVPANAHTAQVCGLPFP